MTTNLSKTALRHRALHAVVTMACALLSGTASAQTAQLAPQAARITDEVIQADHRTYEALQGRIKALNERGNRPVRDYFLAKSQCWLDVSFHEYTRNDRSNFPQAALAESEKLVQGMERGATLQTDTPLVNDALRLRPDLWERVAALKGASGWRCAQQKTACAEVELVHAGNEERQQDWRHAKPYVQIAEDLLGEARELAERCDAPVPVPRVAAPAAPATATAMAAPVPVAPMPLPLVKTVQTVQVVAGVVFNFDKHDAANVRPYSLVQLHEALRRLKAENLVVQSVKLNGHADRLNGTGKGGYNQALSEKRVATVKAELEKLGVSGALVSTQASGDTQPLPGCEKRYASQTQLQECLLPNRRVDVLIEARRP